MEYRGQRFHTQAFDCGEREGTAQEVTLSVFHGRLGKLIFWFDVYFIYFTIGATLLLSVTGLWFIAIMPGVDLWSKRFFRSLFILMLMLNLIGFIDTIAYRYPVLMWIMYFVIILETVLLSLAPLMMTAYLLHCCGENVRSNRLFHAVLGLW